VRIQTWLVLITMVCAAACARTAPDASLEAAEPSGSDVVILVDSDFAETTTSPEPKRGFLGIFNRKNKPSANDAANGSSPEAVTEALIAEGASPVVQEPEGPSMTDDEIKARGIVADSAAEPSTRPRLFGFLRKIAPEVPEDPSPTEIMLATPSGAVEPSMTDEEIAARGEVGLAPSSSGFDLVGTPGFGAFTPACGVRKRDLGTEVARSPGAGTYKLYDTAPSSASPRLQYVTGFKDGCARQFYAALALFGEPVVHETKRYDRTNKRPYSAADEAYETVKRRVCKVGRGEHCPAPRLRNLGRDVALLTAYPSFGGTNECMDVVLFKGTVAGNAVENEASFLNVGALGPRRAPCRSPFRTTRSRGSRGRFGHRRRPPPWPVPGSCTLGSPRPSPWR